MSTKTILYILLTLLIIPSIIAAPEDGLGIDLMNESTLMGIAIAGGVIMGIVMIFKMKKGNKDEFSNVEKLTNNYDTEYKKLSDDTYKGESRFNDIMRDTNTFSDSLNGVGTHSISADIPIIDDTGHLVMKKVSGIENIEKTFEHVEAKTRSDQVKIVKLISDILKNVEKNEQEIIAAYLSMSSKGEGYEKTVEYYNYAEHMRGKIKIIEEDVKKIESYLEVLKKYVSESENLIKTHDEHINSLIDDFEKVTKDNISKAEDAFSKLLEDIHKFNAAYYLDNKTNRQFDDGRNQLYNFKPSYHTLLKPIIDKKKILLGDIDRINNQLGNKSSMEFEISLKDKKRGILWDIIYKFDMRNTKIEQYVSPDNFEYNFRTLENLRKRLKEIVLIENEYNTITAKVDDIIKNTLASEKNLMNNLLTEFENIRQKETMHVKEQEKFIFDEAKYVENVIDNPDPKYDVASKNTELGHRAGITKTKKYDAETKAIIDLLYTQVMDTLKAEMSGKIPENVAYDNIRVAAKNIIKDLKFFTN